MQIIMKLKDYVGLTIVTYIGMKIVEGVFNEAYKLCEQWRAEESYVYRLRIDTFAKGRLVNKEGLA